MLKRHTGIIALLLILAIAFPCFSSCESQEVEKSAYDLAVEQGFEGSLDDWLKTLEAKSAYDLAVEQGFEGTLDEWLKSLEAKSAYDLAVEQGFEGTLDEWLKSLEAKSAYELAVEQGFEGTPEEYLELLNPSTVSVNLGNLFDNDFDKQGYIDPYNGEENSSTSLKYTSKFYAFEKGTLFFKSTKATPSIVFVFYDTNKNYIGYHSFNEQTNSICAFGIDGYFRCYVDESFDGQIYFSTNVPSNPIDYSYSLTKVEKPDDSKRKLTIVNFGDSVFGNTQHSTSISGCLQKIRGDIVYNFGFGGTTLGVRDTATESAWDVFAFHSLVDSVCKNDYSKQEDMLNSDIYFPSYFFTTIDSLKTMDWNTVDVITIAYGTNDYNKDVPLNGDDYDVTNFKGALQYSVKRLQETYPHIRIIVITPILRFFDDGTCSDDADRSGTGTLIDFKDVLLDTCEQLHLPVINAYDDLGLSQYNKPTYFQIDDGCHLNERGRMMYAALISGKIDVLCSDLILTKQGQDYEDM